MKKFAPVPITSYNPHGLTTVNGGLPQNSHFSSTECWRMEKEHYCHDARSWIDIVALADGRFCTDGCVFSIERNEDCYGRPCVYATRTQAIRVSAARAIRHMRHASKWTGMYANGFERPARLAFGINWALATAYRETAAPRPPRVVHIPEPVPAPELVAAPAVAAEPSVITGEAADPWSQF